LAYQAQTSKYSTADTNRTWPTIVVRCCAYVLAPRAAVQQQRGRGRVAAARRFHEPYSSTALVWLYKVED